jgi:hypothetical protein
MLAVDGGDAVGMQARPQTIVCVSQSPLRVVQLCRKLGVAREPPLQLGGELPCALWDRPAYIACPPDLCRCCWAVATSPSTAPAN